MTVSVIMYKRLGISNTDIALYTSWLYLPWVIKPFWSPVIDLLKSLDHPTGQLASKSWDVFAAPDAPKMDFIITVCDNAAGEVCPVWPGQPVTAHWPFPDPAAFEGPEAEKRQVFAEVYGQIRKRAEIFVNLPLAELDKLSLQKRLTEMGEASSQNA